MRLRARDLIGTILVAAIAVPYIGYLVNGEVPFVKDPRGMSATGLILGAIAFAVMRSGDELDRLGRTEIGVAAISLTLGVVTLVLAETGAAEVLLALFMASIAVVWLMEALDHVGTLPGHHPAGTAA